MAHYFFNLLLNPSSSNLEDERPDDRPIPSSMIDFLIHSSAQSLLDLSLRSFLVEYSLLFDPQPPRIVDRPYSQSQFSFQTAEELLQRKRALHRCRPIGAILDS